MRRPGTPSMGWIILAVLAFCLLPNFIADLVQSQPPRRTHVAYP
jgi:hypothetical protein